VAHPVEAVIFDLDGTLIDHIGSVTAALHAWLPTLGAAATAGLVNAWFEAEERHFPARRIREITFAEQRRRRLREFLPLVGLTPGDDDSLDVVFSRYLACYAAAWTKFEDVDPVLDVLAGTELGIAVLTNGIIDQQNAKIDAVGLRGRVGRVCTAEELGVAKPERSTYLAVCAALGVHPGAALHVGDRHDLDVLAARAAGLQAVHVDRSGAGPFDEPHRITSLAQLPTLLREW
jgi:putative hydrolase of the HAD superfamily